MSPVETKLGQRKKPCYALSQSVILLDVVVHLGPQMTPCLCITTFTIRPDRRLWIPQKPKHVQQQNWQSAPVWKCYIDRGRSLGLGTENVKHEVTRLHNVVLISAVWTLHAILQTQCCAGTSKHACTIKTRHAAYNVHQNLEVQFKEKNMNHKRLDEYQTVKVE